MMMILMWTPMRISHREWNAYGSEGSARSSGATQTKEMLEPLMAKSLNVTGSLGFNETHFYRYMLKINKNYFVGKWSLITDSKTGSTMSTSHIGIMVAPTLHPIGGLAAS